jgi:hypothetical protein
LINFFFSPHFFPGLDFGIILWAFLIHRIHWHPSHFAFIHRDFLDFTQPTQICSLCRFRRVSVIVATSSSSLLVSIIQSIHRIPKVTPAWH